jgi:spermidine synthase
VKISQNINQYQLVYLSNDSSQISILENEYYRWLMFDDVIQSIMHLRQPKKLTLPHQYAALMPLLFFKPKRVIELGLGGGNISRFLSALNFDIEVTSVELSSQVIHCFNDFFNPLRHNITIENSAALAWLQNKERIESKSADWLICDVYQHHADSFQNRVKLLTALIENLADEGCLTINLPDLDDHEINLCLTILKQLQNSHQIIYFHIPRYLNIVIHLLPNHWPINNLKKRSKTTALPAWQYSRWRKHFTHHIKA